MDEMTIGEIARSLARLEASQREQTQKLDEIKEQTTKTNGSVLRHEDKLVAHDREIRDLKRSRATHELKRATDTAEAITLSIPTNKKALTVMLSTAGAIIAAAFTAVAKLLGWL